MDNRKKADIAKYLRKCILAEGSVVAAFEGYRLIGFSNIEDMLIGEKHEYVEMEFIL